MSETLQPLADLKVQFGDAQVVDRSEARIVLERLKQLDDVHRTSAVFAGLAARVHEGDGVVSVESIGKHLSALGTPMDDEKIQAILRNKGFRQVKRYEADKSFVDGISRLSKLELSLKHMWPNGDAVHDEGAIAQDYDEPIRQHRQYKELEEADAAEAEKVQLLSLIGQIKALREELRRKKEEMSEPIGKFRLNPVKAEQWFRLEGTKLGISLEDVDELLILVAGVPIGAVRLDPGFTRAMAETAIDPNDPWFNEDHLDGLGTEGASWLNWAAL